MTHKRFQFNKLVRDLVVTHCEEQGCKLEVRLLDKAEHVQELLAKLVEEATEVAQAQSREERIKELGDLLEVFQTLLSLEEISSEDVEEARQKKRAKKGGFESGSYILTNTIPANHEDIPGFLAQPEKYPFLGDVEL